MIIHASPGDGWINLHQCDQPNCTKKFKKASALKQHKADVHDIDVTWHQCDQPNCTEKFKRANNLKEHKAFVHNIDVKWHQCDQSNCTEKFKKASDLKRHKAFAHDIDVTWHQCDQPNCTEKFKQASDLKRHKEVVHDIGKHKCVFCLGNRNSQNKYEDTNGKHSICNACYKRATGKGSRIETVWSDYIHLPENLGTTGHLSSDKNLKSLGGCQLYRPDDLNTDEHYVELGECDEHQHLRKSGNYSCDEKRISDIYDEEGIVGKTMSVLRWNPDTYKVPSGYTRIPLKERLNIYVALAKKLRDRARLHKIEDSIHIYYMFYSDDNERLSKNIPHTLIYSMDDVNKI